MATLIVIFHLLFIIFVIFGALLLRFWPRLIYVHLSAAIWGVLVEFADFYCPLTQLEHYYLRQQGSEGYSGDFIAAYLLPLIYPAGITREIQFMLGFAVLVINGFFYFRYFRSRRSIDTRGK
jgi:hypothetical protein